MPVKKAKLFCCIFLISFFMLFNPSKADEAKKVKPDKVLTMFLYPEVNQQVDNYYKEYISDGPTVAPYSIDIIDIFHTPEKYSQYNYTIVVETMPYVGAHVSVGLDRITLNISFGDDNNVLVKPLLFEHLESYTIPSWLEHHVIKPLP